MSDEQLSFDDEPVFEDIEDEDVEREQPSFAGFTDGPEHGPMLFRDQVPRSVRMYRIGGRLYPMKSEPTCHTCQSPYRFQIERHLADGRAYARIVRDLPDDAGVSAESISRHKRNGHLPLNEEEYRQIVERVAAEQGIDIIEHEGTLLDRRAFAKVGLQKVYERMMRGEIEPDIKDGIAFAKLIEDMESGQDADMEALRRYVLAQYEVAREVMTEEQLQQWARGLNTHPYLSEIASVGPGRDEDIVDADVVEEG